MAKKTVKIDALKLVRAIRDRHAAALAGKSPAEILAFYRQAGTARRSHGERGSGRRGLRRGDAGRRTPRVRG